MPYVVLIYAAGKLKHWKQTWQAVGPRPTHAANRHLQPQSKAATLKV